MSNSDAVSDAAATAATPDAAAADDTGAASDAAASRRPVSARSTAETAAAAAVLRSAGWHVTTIDVDTPLPNAWQRLPRAAEMLVATGTTIYPATGSGRPA